MTETQRLLARIEQDRGHPLFRYYEVEEYDHGERHGGKRLGLSHHFPGTVYGVSSIATMMPETAKQVAEAMLAWVREQSDG